MSRAVAIAILIGAAAPATGAGQSLERDLIAQAEAAGAAHRRLTNAGEHWALRKASGEAIALQAGSIDRKCVAGAGIGPIRSGEFVIGGQVTFTLAGRTAKIWWAPLHHASDMEPLVVTARSVTTPGDTFVFTSDQLAWVMGADLRAPVPESERKYFFPSGFSSPRPGRWLLIATSGANWGCFIHDVKAVAS